MCASSATAPCVRMHAPLHVLSSGSLPFVDNPKRMPLSAQASTTRMREPEEQTVSGRAGRCSAAQLTQNLEALGSRGQVSPLATPSSFVHALLTHVAMHAPQGPSQGVRVKTCPRAWWMRRSCSSAAEPRICLPGGGRRGGGEGWKAHMSMAVTVTRMRTRRVPGP